MAKTRQRKQEELTNFSKKLKDAKVVLFTSFADQNKKGVDVSNMRKLKKGLRALDSEYIVIKKTLAKKAFDEVFPGSNVETKKLSGSVGYVLGFKDQVAPAQFIYKFLRQNDLLEILGAMIDGKVLSGGDAVAFAKLPNREVLLAQLLGAIKSPIQDLHTVLQANLKNLVLILSNIKK